MMHLQNTLSQMVKRLVDMWRGETHAIYNSVKPEKYCLLLFFPEFRLIKSFIDKRNFLKDLFIYFIFWLQWVFIAACGLSLVATPHHSAQASHCSGFSCCIAQPPGIWVSVVAELGLSSCGSWTPECRLSNCGTRALLPYGMWNLPIPGMKPMSLTLQDRFLTTATPQTIFLFLLQICS